MKIDEHLLKKVQQEYDNSGGELTLNRLEFQDYFGFDQAITTKVIEELIATGRFELVKELDLTTGETVEIFQIHLKYKRNYWLKVELEEREAEILLELGAQLKHPFNSRIKNIGIENNRVIKLDLREQQLQSIPDSIGELLELKTLILQKNQLTTLPTTLTNLKKLKNLDLDHNPIKNLPNLMSSIKTNLPNLTYVWIEGKNYFYCCPTCGKPFCKEYNSSCKMCGESFCKEHISENIWTCKMCGESFCKEHIRRCQACGESFCIEHVCRCQACGESFCIKHVCRCQACGESICIEHIKGSDLRTPNSMVTCLTREALDALTKTRYYHNLSWLDNIKRFVVSVAPTNTIHFVFPNWVTWEVKEVRSGILRPVMVVHFRALDNSALRWKPDTIFLTFIICSFVTDNWGEFGFPDKVVSNLIGQDYVSDFDVSIVFEDPTCEHCEEVYHFGDDDRINGKPILIGWRKIDGKTIWDKLECPSCGFDYNAYYKIDQLKKGIFEMPNSP